MRDLTVDWTALMDDIYSRVRADEDHEQILADLYYGVEAELDGHSLLASEDDIERLSKALFDWCTMRKRGEKLRIALFQIKLVGLTVTA